MGWHFSAITEELVDGLVRAEHLDPKRSIQRGRVITIRRILLAGRNNKASRHFDCSRRRLEE